MSTTPATPSVFATGVVKLEPVKYLNTSSLVALFPLWVISCVIASTSLPISALKEICAALLKLNPDQIPAPPDVLFTAYCTASSTIKFLFLFKRYPAFSLNAPASICSHAYLIDFHGLDSVTP